MAENRASAYGEGVPCWVDAQLADVEAGKRFYGELFGWTFQDRPETGGVWACREGEAVAGLARKTDGRLCEKADPDFFRDCCPELIRVNGGRTPATPSAAAGSGAASDAPSGDRPSTVDACARIKAAS